MKDAERKFLLRVAILQAQQAIMMCAKPSSSHDDIRKVANVAFNGLGQSLAPEHGCPDAPYLMGRLSASIAGHLLNSEDPDRANADQIIRYLIGAEEYFQMTIDRPDSYQEGLRFYAMDALADLYDCGILHDPRDIWRKAHMLRVKAADGGCEMAMYHLAQRYHDGAYGVEPNPKRAQKYMSMLQLHMNKVPEELHKSVHKLNLAIKRSQSPVKRVWKQGVPKVIMFPLV